MSEVRFEVKQRVVVVSKSNLKTYSGEDDGEYDVTRGLVKSIGEDGQVTVKLDGRWHDPNPAKFAAKDLMPEEEANVILSKLEADFEAWAGPVREKLKQAGQLLVEADKLTNQNKRDLSEMHELTHPLMKAMEDIGWRTSSLTC